MTDFEKEVIDRLGRIETKLDADFRAIHGNGKPGLVDKVAELSAQVVRLCGEQKPSNRELGNRVAEIEARHKSGDAQRNRKLEWFAILSSAAGTLYALFK